MPLEDKGYVSSLLIKGHKYEPNLNTIEENGQTTHLYKIRVHFNEEHYDLCIAIGDLKALESVDYKYVYVVKYGMVVSKLGVYEFIRGSNKDYKEGSLLLFDNFADSYKLKDLKQSKDEYISMQKNKILKSIKQKVKDKSKDSAPYEKKYATALKGINTLPEKDLLLKTLKFYDTLHKTIDIDTIEFMKDGILDKDLVNKYKDESMTYNEFLRVIFGEKLELLDELDEFEDNVVSIVKDEGKEGKEDEDDDEDEDDEDEDEGKETEDEDEPKPATNKPVIKPATKPVIEPATKPVSEPVIKPATKPVSIPEPTKPATKPVSEPVIKPLDEPEPTKPLDEPVIEPVSIPEPTKPLDEPEPTKPLDEPATNKPVSELANQLSNENSTTDSSVETRPSSNSSQEKVGGKLKLTKRKIKL
jgi:hypothetical protein